jgi:hypothetical protein
VKPHVFLDGEGVVHDNCVVCGEAREVSSIDVTPIQRPPGSDVMLVEKPCRGRKPPYPFCSQAEKCIAAGRCERTVRGERWSCAD